MPETLFDHPVLICDQKDQGAKIRAICIFNGVQVDKEFVVGPITLRPFNAETDKFPEGIRRELQHSVLELNYVDRKGSLSMYAEPMWVQENAFKAIQIMLNNWTGISLIYHLNEANEQIGGASGSTRYETADTESPNRGGILVGSDENKELFKTIFWACLGELKHPINRYGRACAEIKAKAF